MYKRFRLALFLFSLAPLLLILVLCSGVYSLYQSMKSLDDDPRIASANDFLAAAFSGNETKAYGYLSYNARNAVAKHCLNGEVIHCFDGVIDPKWGKFASMAFEANYNESAKKAHIMFPVVWKNASRLVFVTVVKEGSVWRVDSWRGFIPLNSSDDERSSLLDGTAKTNQFPPDSIGKDS